MVVTTHVCCAEGFVDALHYWQTHSQVLPAATDPAAASDEPPGPSALTLSLRYSDAATAITPKGQGSISPALLACLMLAAHHPVISGPRKQPGAAWSSVKHRVSKLGVLFDGVLLMQPTCSFILQHSAERSLLARDVPQEHSST